MVEFTLGMDDLIPLVQEPVLQQVIIPTLEQNPDQYSKDLATGNKLNLPVGAIGNENRDDLERQKRALDLNEQLSDTKLLRQLIQGDRDLSFLVQDDVPNAATLERASRELSFTGRFAEGVRMMQGLGWSFTEAIGEKIDDPSLVALAAKEAQARLATITPIMKIEDVGSVDDFYNWMVAHAGQQIPLMAPGLVGSIAGGAVGTAILPGVGTLIGVGLGAFIPSFVFGVGETQQAIKALDPSVAAPDIAFTSGAIIGALDALLPGRLGTRIVKAFGIDVAGEVMQLTARKLLKAAAIAGVEGMAIEGVTEAIQEAVSFGAAHLATGKEIDEAALASDMLNAFAVGAFMGGTVGTVTGTASEMVKTRRQKKLLDVLNKEAKGSKLRQRNVGKFSDMMDVFLRDGGINQFIINTDILLHWANQNPDGNILDVLGVTEQLDSEEVILNPKTFSAFVLGVEQYENLIMFVRTPDGRSMESVSKDFSDLEYSQLLRNELAAYPVSEELKEKVVQTLDKFHTADTAEVYDQAPVDVNAILNSLVRAVEEKKLDVTDVILQGRLNLLDIEIRRENEKILELEKEAAIREREGRPTAAIEKKVDKAFQVRGDLLDQQAKISLAGPVVTEIKGVELIEEAAVEGVKKRKGQKPIITKAATLLKLAVASNTQAIRATRVAFREGLRAAKNLVAKKKAILKVLKTLPLKDKQILALATRINNAETFTQFMRAAAIVQVRADALMVREHRRAIVAAIQKLVKKTKLKGKEGKFDPEVQEFLDDVRDIISLPKKTIEEQRQLEDIYNARLDDPSPNPDEAWKTILYALLLGEDTVNMIDAENFLLDVAIIKASGKHAALVRVQIRKNKQEADIIDATEAVLAGKEPEMIDTSSLAARLHHRFQQGAALKDAILEEWNNLLDIMFNKEGVDVKTWERLKESLRVDFNIQDWKAENIKWETKFLDLYREGYGLKNNNQALNLMAEDEVVADLGVFEDRAGRKVRLQYSKAQRRKLWMEQQDPNLKEVFESEAGNALTPQMLIALEIEGKDKAFAEGQLEIYRDFYHRINVVYRKLYGVNLPFNAVYSPVVRDKGVDVEGEEGRFGEEDTIINEMSFRRSFPKALLRRKKNEIRIGKQSDVSTMYQHIHNMSWFIHMAEKTLHIGNVFKNEPLRKAIRLQHSQGMLSNVNGWIDDFKVGRIKRGNWFNQFISGVNKRFAESVLSIKPTIGIKQLTSWFAMADNIPVKDFMKYQAEFFRHPKKIMKFLYENSASLQARGNSLEFELARLGAVEKSVFNIKNKKRMHDVFFALIRMGDRFPIYAGGWAVYQHAVMAGKTHKQAVKIFEDAFNTTQQSVDLDKMAPAQRDHAIGRTLTIFMTARLALLRGEMKAWRHSPLPVIGRKKISWAEFGKRIAVYHFVMPTLIQYIANGFDWEWEDQLVAAVVGQLNSFIILGDFLTAVVASIITEDKKIYDIDTDLPLVDILNEVYRGVRAVGRGDWETEEMLNALHDIGAVTGKLAGLPIEQIMNALGGMGDIEDAEIEKGMKRIIGLSEKVAEKSSEE